jgi:SAM-dependent methyltransferase
MNATKRSGEYRARGDYHRELDPAWSYAPIYKRKIEIVDRFAERLPDGARLVDVGCGEGALVERYRARGLETSGVDVDYESEHVRRASLLSLPFGEASFNAVLCLDVLEHISLLDQPVAVAEIYRVLTPGGRLLVSVPNLAHLHSRLRFFFGGRFTRTSAIDRHPGDRPVVEYLDLLQRAGFAIGRRWGIFPTVPLFFRLVNRHTARFGWLVPWLDRLLPFPGWCFLNVIEATKS